MRVKKTIESQEILAAVDRMAEAIAAEHAQSSNLLLAGIANGGVPLCEMLEAAVARRLGGALPKATIDISFHRDDINHKPITKEVQATEMAADPEDATVILVDDVLFSGRTIRAAIAELFTIGRPYKVELAVLVDRGNRRLPFAANYAGLIEPTTPEEVVKVALDPAEPERSRVDILQP